MRSKLPKRQDATYRAADYPFKFIPETV